MEGNIVQGKRMEIHSGVPRHIDVGQEKALSQVSGRAIRSNLIYPILISRKQESADYLIYMGLTLDYAIPDFSKTR